LRAWLTSVEARVGLADRAAKGASNTSLSYTFILRTKTALFLLTGNSGTSSARMNA
jgi:hypothetical protein